MARAVSRRNVAIRIASDGLPNYSHFCSTQNKMYKAVNLVWKLNIRLDASKPLGARYAEVSRVLRRM